MIHRSHRLRVERVSLIGQAYHVTFATDQRAPVLANFWAARAVIRVIRNADELKLSETHALTVMSDHVHWLFTLQSGDLSPLVGRVKTLSARAIHHERGGSGVLWQRDFYDHAVRNDEALVEIARYFVANPLRAKLVDSVADYPHWYARWL